MDIQKAYEELLPHIPAMKDDPKLWKKRIQAFVDAKPKVMADEEFLKELKASLLQAHEAMSVPKYSWKNLLPVFSGVGGLALGALAMVMFVGLPKYSQDQYVPGELNSETMVMEVMDDESAEEDVYSGQTTDGTAMNMIAQEPEAFGEISIGAPAAVDEAMLSSRSRPQSGGGVTAENAKVEPAVSSMSIAPRMGGRINYEYVLNEELPTVPEQTMIYKKQKPAQGLIKSSFLEPVFAERMDFQRLSDINFSYLNFKANIGESLYYVNVNFDDGSLGMNEDYQSLVRSLCSDTQNCPLPALSREDMPSDGEVIKVAQEFLNGIGVSLENTLTPIVERPWEDQEEEYRYYPDAITVFFPYSFDGLGVRETWGSGGIRVTVNIRVNKVADLYIPYMDIAESAYPAQNVEDLMLMLSKGGIYGNQYTVPDETVEVKLENARVELREISTYDRATSTNTVYYVPALVADTVRDEEENEYWIPQEVVVPLSGKVKP